VSVNLQVYHNEELQVYDHILDIVLDSISSQGREQDSARQVFYISDTLARSGHVFFETELGALKFSVPLLTHNSRHRFIRTGDTLRLNDNEIFIKYWLTISRVSLDENFTAGMLRLETWCGDLCGAGYIVEIVKTDGRWTVKKCTMMWVS